LACFETKQVLAREEADQCQETGKLVRPGVLVICEASGLRVLPSECARCSVTNKKALRRLLVMSSLSGATMLSEIAIRSSSGAYCLPAETSRCLWTGTANHPDDIGICTLTNLQVHKSFLTSQNLRLKPLFELLNDLSSEATGQELPILEAALSKALDGRKCRMVSGAMSPTKAAMAICAQVKSYLGLRTNYVGGVFAPSTGEVIGKVVVGKRTKQGWLETQSE
jgi:hypothetical protein